MSTNDSAPMPETVAVEPTPRFLLVKRGLYYGPDNRGYTGIKERAGRYFEADASPEDGITAIHEDDAQMFAPACFEDIKIEYLLGLLQSSAEQVLMLREALSDLLAVVDEEGLSPEFPRTCDAAREALKDTM